MVSASVFITSVSSSAQENSPAVVNEENRVSEVTFLLFFMLPVLFHEMIHQNVFPVHRWALLGIGVGQSQLPGLEPGQP